jgi:hypothetical protein
MDNPWVVCLGLILGAKLISKAIDVAGDAARFRADPVAYKEMMKTHEEEKTKRKETFWNGK